MGENDLLNVLYKKYGEQCNKMAPIQIKKVYSIGSKIGTGGCAVVRKCKHRKYRKVFALKCIKKTNKDSHSEIDILRQISHPNIVQLYDVFTSRSKTCLVFYLLEGGELFDHIVQNGAFSEHRASMIFTQIIEALSYLHDQSIVHGDLKPENILFATKSEDSIIKIIDFGVASFCKDIERRPPRGTPNYIAPETLRKSEYSTQSDMWSVGVILYIMLCGFPPFYNKNVAALCKLVKRAQYDMPSPFWDGISKNAKDLVRKLLQRDPKKRLTAKMTLKHPWLNGKSVHRASH